MRYTASCSVPWQAITLPVATSAAGPLELLAAAGGGAQAAVSSPAAAGTGPLSLMGDCLWLLLTRFLRLGGAWVLPWSALKRTSAACVATASCMTA